MLFNSQKSNQHSPFLHFTSIHSQVTSIHSQALLLKYLSNHEYHKQALDCYVYALKQMEDFSAVTIRNYLSNLRQFVTWCECFRDNEQDERLSTLQRIVSSLLIRHRTYLQTILLINNSAINRVNSTACSILLKYFEIQSPKSIYLLPPEKTGNVLTERAQIYLIAKYAKLAYILDIILHDLRHRFGYQIAGVVFLHQLAQIMGHDSLDTTMLYIRGTKQDLQ